MVRRQRPHRRNKTIPIKTKPSTSSMNQKQLKNFSKHTATFLTTFAATILLITIHNNTWMLWEFCGSLNDFQDGAAPEVCLTLPQYLYHATTHPPYLASATILSTTTTLAFRFRETIKNKIHQLR